MDEVDRLGEAARKRYLTDAMFHAKVYRAVNVATRTHMLLDPYDRALRDAMIYASALTLHLEG